jgi:uncharacterized protein YaiI (UPF0178 family)
VVFWIDADSCPRPVRQIVTRRALKLQVGCVMVSCQSVPPEPGASLHLVPKGEQAADQLILQELNPGDLVITRDLNLALSVLERGGHAMNDRGVLWKTDLLREKISLARYTQQLYESGLENRASKNYGPKDVQEFAKGFDAWVQKLLRELPGNDAK